MEMRLSFTISACTKSCPLIGSMDTCLPFYFRAGEPATGCCRDSKASTVRECRPRAQDACGRGLRATDNSDNHPDNRSDNPRSRDVQMG